MQTRIDSILCRVGTSSSYRNWFLHLLQFTGDFTQSKVSTENCKIAELPDKLISYSRERLSESFFGKTDFNLHLHFIHLHLHDLLLSSLFLSLSLFFSFLFLSLFFPFLLFFSIAFWRRGGASEAENRNFSPVFDI